MKVQEFTDLEIVSITLNLVFLTIFLFAAHKVVLNLIAEWKLNKQVKKVLKDQKVMESCKFPSFRYPAGPGSSIQVYGRDQKAARQTWEFMKRAGMFNQNK